jgi:transcriptional regulator with PAS, ATPase and Fis domain
MVAANIFLYLDRLALAGVCHKDTPSLLKIFDKFIEKIELFESFKVWQPKLLAGDSFITVFEALINDRVKNPDGLDWVMIRHPKMFRAFIDAMEYAFDEEPCLIIGETGTGKETLARCIHAFSGRGGSKFVPINCGAFTDDLFVSATQGHVKGAFTGANQANPGIFLSANGGTVFLDEMSSLNPRPQAVLLRTIQFGEVQPVGKEYDSKTTDVRVIGSLNSDPLQLIREGKLREDLYFRMTKGIIKVPPLRELIDNFDCIVDGIIKQKLEKKNAKNKDDKSSIIKSDIALPSKIVKEFKVSKNAMRMLKEHAWPGNFRELDNVITQALTKMSRSGDVILKPIYIENLIGTKMIKQNENNRDYSNIKFKDLKKEYLTYIHKKASGKPFAAEKLSGMGRKAIERCWEKYGLSMPGKRG